MKLVWILCISCAALALAACGAFPARAPAVSTLTGSLAGAAPGSVLTEDNWHDLDEAFAQNRDSMTGHAPDLEYNALFTRIVNIVPAPYPLRD